MKNLIKTIANEKLKKENENKKRVENTRKQISEIIYTREQLIKRKKEK